MYKSYMHHTVVAVHDRPELSVTEAYKLNVHVHVCITLIKHSPVTILIYMYYLCVCNNHSANCIV